MANKKKTVELVLTGKLVEVMGLTKEGGLCTPTYGGLYCDESMDVVIEADGCPLYVESDDEYAVMLNERMNSSIKEIKLDGTAVSCIDLIKGNGGEYTCTVEVDGDLDVEKLSLNIAHWVFFVDDEKKWDAWEQPTLYGIVYDGKEYELTLKERKVSALNRESFVWGNTPLNKIVKGKYGFIDKEGNLVIPTQYDMAWSNFENGFAQVKIAGKVGFIDKTGKEVIPIKYQDFDSSSLSNGLISAKLNGKYGVIDMNGNEIIPFMYDYFINFDEYGLASVKNNGSYGYIDRDNNEVTPAQYDGDFICVRNEFVIRKYGRKYDMINRKTREVFPFKKFDKILTPFVDGKAITRNTTKDVAKYQIVDLKGKTIKALEYDEVKDIMINGFDSDGRIISYYQEGVLLAKKDKKIGLINHLGEVIVPLQYDSVQGYGGNKSTYQTSDIVISAKFGEKTEWIDLHKQEIVDTPVIASESSFVKNAKNNDLYDNVWEFDAGICVKKDGKYGMLSKAGEEIVPPIYDSQIMLNGEGLYLIKREGKYGYINAEGKEIVPPMYDSADLYFSEGMAMVKRDGKEGFVNMEGVEIIPPIYASVSSFKEGLARVKF